MLIDWASLNYLPVIVGGVVYIIYGGIYYSVLLSKKKEKNRDIAEKQTNGPFKYIYSVIIAFISSLFMAILVQSVGSEYVLTGTGIGFIIGLIISIVYLKNALFGLMSKKSLLIAIGDHLIIFTLLGTIHGLFLSF